MHDPLCRNTVESLSAASSSSNNASSPSRLKLITIGKQKTVNLTDSNQTLIKEGSQNNTSFSTSATAKRDAFKANRANAFTIVDVHTHHLPFLEEICDNENDNEDGGDTGDFSEKGTKITP